MENSDHNPIFPKDSKEVLLLMKYQLQPTLASQMRKNQLNRLAANTLFLAYEELEKLTGLMVESGVDAQELIELLETVRRDQIERNGTVLIGEKTNGNQARPV